MAVYTNQPLLDLDFVKPSRFIIDVASGAIDGGKNGLGQSISMDMSGGGFVTCTLDGCFVQAREEHEYINMLAARLRGSFRFIDVPFKTDWMGPFPTYDRWPVPIVGGIPHSDGALFSDGSGYSQATVWGRIMESADINAGQLRIRVYNPSRPFRMSDWFSINHTTKGWRAYRYWDVLQRFDDGIESISGTPISYQEFQVALEIPLREAVNANIRVELARPRCVMKFAPGFTLAWDVQGWWRSNPTLNFVEAF